MPKQILFKEEARRKIKDGIDKITDAIKVTLGPKGRHVVLDKGFGAPEICDDGVTIAKEIELSDKVENMGAEIVKQVAEKTNDMAGDGTSTAVVLTQAICAEGLKNVAAGANPLALRRGIEKTTKAVVEELKKMSKQISNKEEIAQVANISAGNTDIGKLIAEVVSEVGKDGVITVEESKTFGLSKEIVKGLQFDRGYISPYMITNPERMEAVFEDPLIFITDKKISSVQDILPVMEAVANLGKKELVIIAEDVDGEALATLLVNKIRGIFNTLAIKAPGFGDRKKETLEDIAIVTRGKVYSEEIGIKVTKSEEVGVEEKDAKKITLGQARKVIATKENTTIIGGKGDDTPEGHINSRIEQIKSEIKNSTSDFDKEKLQERLAKLSGGVAVIKVGAATEVEQKAVQRKTEDALNATRAAIEEGILPGGGVALLRSIAALADFRLEGDEKTGLNILKAALEKPIRQIAENAGVDGAVVAEEVKKHQGSFGFNAETLQYEDLIQSGIIDPTKVVRSALENSASAAAMILTIEAVVAEKPEEKKGDAAGGMPPMNMGY